MGVLRVGRRGQIFIRGNIAFNRNGSKTNKIITLNGSHALLPNYLEKNPTILQNTDATHTINNTMKNVPSTNLLHSLVSLIFTAQFCWLPKNYLLNRVFVGFYTPLRNTNVHSHTKEAINRAKILKMNIHR